MGWCNGGECAGGGLLYDRCMMKLADQMRGRKLVYVRSRAECGVSGQVEASALWFGMLLPPRL
jgi:hypothetical protein